MLIDKAFRAGLAAGSSRASLAQLFGVTPTDVWTGAASIAILGLVALVSGLVPARRASAVDPITALPYE